jgi:hypothetical protein
MLLGHGYDMVLPPRHPTDEDHELSQPGGALRRYRRSYQARAATTQFDYTDTRNDAFVSIPV